MTHKMLGLGLGFIATMFFIAPMSVHAATSGAATVTATQTSDQTYSGTTTTKANINLNAGSAISLDSAPGFEFGEHTLDQTKQTFDATGAEPVQVTNAGWGSGWNVTATLGEFQTKSDLTLRGATLTFGTNSDYQPSTATGSLDQYALGKDGLFTADGSRSFADGTQAVRHDVTIGAGETQTVLDAGLNEGVGIWQAAYTAQLTVPAGNVAGDYVADLTWTLTNAPTK